MCRAAAGYHLDVSPSRIGVLSPHDQFYFLGLYQASINFSSKTTYFVSNLGPNVALDPGTTSTTIEPVPTAGLSSHQADDHTSMESIDLSSLGADSTMDSVSTRGTNETALPSLPPSSYQNNMSTGADNNSSASSQLRGRHSQNPAVDNRQPSPTPLKKIADRVVDSPLMGVLSASVCFIRGLEILSYFSVKNTITQELKNVNSLYAPAPFFIWLFTVNTLMYDVATYDETNQKQRSTSPWFDKARLAGILLYGFAAVMEHLIRSAIGQTTPSQAAARYVADKAFESIGILFAIVEWKKFRNRNVTRNDLPQDRLPQTARTYLYWLPFIFFLAFSVGRALERHIDRYVIPLESEHYKLTWNPVIPKEYRPISLGVGLLFGLLSSHGNLKSRCEEGWIKVVWMSNVILHSGIFGTLGPLRLTDKDPTSVGQWLPFVIFVIGTCWQYWRDLVNLPAAARKRFSNIYKWHSE
ncbi:hypothetical protein DL98DRAFT_574259 [Cadophora sp. DSE1049]|nr:hypothetical protein DL98DRAFT_574259 [Cadophora sp. DSE1049]